MQFSRQVNECPVPIAMHPGVKRSLSEEESPSAKRAYFRSFSLSGGVGNGVSQRESNGQSKHNYSDSQHHRQTSPLSSRKQRFSLPIYSGRTAIIAEVRMKESIIIVGETGSGKTTQIPQYIYEDRLTKLGAIACTQPRRVAAISIAQRVAKEMSVHLGEEVGYTVRFEDVTSEKTRVKYMTDGMLLREAIGDSLLLRYAVVILDEAHERTVHTDVLFGVVKSAQRMRKENNQKPLKIVVMSATLEADHFSRYFNGAKVLYIEGRQHPIQMMYTVEQQKDYVHAALVTIMQLHQEMPPGGDILVFLTGQDEIESLAKLVTDCAQHCASDCPELLVCPMFASLPSQHQMKVFISAPLGKRKVILATNIAETSITIPGVKYVIDTGFVKGKAFHPKTGLDMLQVQPVSKAQARQRTGRAGRETSGVCYRLYTEEQFDELKEATTPEIQRCNLATVILQLMALGISDVVNFDFLDRPPQDAIETAFEQLVVLGAVRKGSGGYELMPLGRQMAEFPLEPRLAKVILCSQRFNCSEEIITIVALLSVDSLTYTPQSKRDHAIAIRKKFTSSEGDQMTLLNIYRAYRAVNGNKEWCFQHFINSQTVKQVMDIRKQLREICVRMNITLNSCGKETANIRETLARGLFMNAAQLQLDGSYQTVTHRQPVSIHPTSSLFGSKPQFVVYNELVHTSKCYMRDVCVVDPSWLRDAAPNYFKEHRLHSQPTAIYS
ncbi:ATP-dependent RNA helicase DHX33-like [Montipora foliosa]|uniref:ATP-dependent RNA helicase DHX33-like n=1 Tax=Montipora foliosa TaxID=591990 RepID=UPI0035F1E97D